MHLLCVYGNLFNNVGFNNVGFNKFFSDGSRLFLFPFVTCVKESENQPNGVVESRRKSQSSPFQKVKAKTNASSLVLELLEHG